MFKLAATSTPSTDVYGFDTAIPHWMFEATMRLPRLPPLPFSAPSSGRFIGTVYGAFADVTSHCSMIDTRACLFRAYYTSYAGHALTEIPAIGSSSSADTSSSSSADGTSQVAGMYCVTLHVSRSM